jgi:RNA polymerase sigma factor (sigma-70 family)
LRTLFHAGTSAGLTDGQLLERCARRDNEAAEAAFAALLERHGPMVLRTCRSILRHEHDAQDAFQATFLILVRRSGVLWVRHSLAPWLHRVACRAAVRALRDATRRNEAERRAAERTVAERSGGDPAGGELGVMIQQELNRLPDRYRIPVLLCDLEGRTYEQAAQVLRCPVGTVKSRLARGRERLRSKLMRRGLAPGIVATSAALDEVASAALPAALVEATMLFAVVEGAAVAASVTALATGVLRSMFLSKLRLAAVFLLAAGVMVGGLAAAGARAQPNPVRGPQAVPVARTEPAQARPMPPQIVPTDSLAWRRSDVYEAPDFDRFFPNDPEGGRALDALWAAKDRNQRSDAEILRTVRQGLRHAQQPSEILRWIGGRYIWSKPPQNPDAIEILYHALDYHTDNNEAWQARHYSVYFGLSVVQPKPPAILRTLADLCMASDDPNDLDRVAWGAASQRAELLACLKPYLSASDEATRGKAADVARILGGELEAFAWAKQRATLRARTKYADRLPEIKRLLATGSAAQRKDALRLIEQGIASLMDDTFVAAFAACAEEKDRDIRQQVAIAVGGRWIWGANPQNPGAIELELRLSNDPDRAVRYNAVYYGLSTVREKSEAVVRRLLEFAMSDQSDLYQRIGSGLQADRDTAARVLKDLLEHDPARAKDARRIFKDMTGLDPPADSSGDPAPQAGYTAALRELYEHLEQVYPCFSMKGIDWKKVGDELLPRAAQVRTEEQFGLLVEELVARLEDSHAVVMPGTARPPVPDLPQWDPGLACLIDDRGWPVVYVVEPASPADKAGVRPGMRVVSVHGVPAEDEINRWSERQRKYVGYSSARTLRYDAARGFLQQPEKGTKLTLVLEDPEGQRMVVDATADLKPRYLPRLPVPRNRIADAANVSWTPLGDGIGYIYVRRIAQQLEGSLDQALADLGAVAGLIIDVRGNSGGGFDANTAFRNFDRAADNSAEPKRPCYRGPIALLIDERSISAGEGWASWFIAHKRARVFGTTSAGASARKETYTLSNGLYRIVVPVKAYAGFLDRPIERRGLEPDVEIRCSARDLARARDTIVEAAVKWLAAEAHEPTR